MSTIHIKQAHSEDQAHARQHANETVEALADKFGMKYQWQEDTVKFSGAGAKGFMSVAPGVVEIKIELSLMLRPFKGKIEQEITKHLADFAA